MCRPQWSNFDAAIGIQGTGIAARIPRAVECMFCVFDRYRVLTVRHFRSPCLAMETGIHARTVPVKRGAFLESSEAKKAGKVCRIKSAASMPGFCFTSSSVSRYRPTAIFSAGRSVSFSRQSATCERRMSLPEK
jgi:hypothetical protein